MDQLLNLPLIGDTRRNHAIEHATIHILSKQFPNRPMGGHSNPTGFFVIGDLPTDAIQQAVDQALERLENGESELAIHEGCGTNYVVMGSLAALGGILGMVGTRNTRERLDRFPLLMAFSMVGYIAGQILGPALQRSVTTDPKPNGMRVIEIMRTAKNVHRVVTTH